MNKHIAALLSSDVSPFTKNIQWRTWAEMHNKPYPMTVEERQAIIRESDDDTRRQACEGAEVQVRKG